MMVLRGWFVSPVSLGQPQQLIHGVEMLLFRVIVCHVVYMLSNFKNKGQSQSPRGVKQ